MKYIILGMFVSASALANPKTGRFHLYNFDGGNLRGQYLLDTETGNIWRPACSPKVADCSLLIWSKEVVEGVNANREQIKKLVE